MLKSPPPCTVVASHPTTSVGQFLALLSSSHPRCGARSPARMICCVGPIMSAMWRDVVLPTALLFEVVLERPSTSPMSCCSVPITVSPLLGSVLNRAVTPAVTGTLKWLTRRSVMHTQVQFAKDSSAVTASIRDGLLIIWFQTGGRGLCECANSKWLIACESLPGDAGRVLAIRSLPTNPAAIRNCGSHQAAAAVVVDPAVVLVPESDAVSSFSPVLFFNKVVPDEALMCTANFDQAVFTLFDVELTFQSKKLAVVACARADWTLDDPCMYDTALVMRRASGGVVFVTKPVGDDNFVRAVDGRTGNARRLGDRGAVIMQVDSSVFCICTNGKSSYELWDCNNLEQPLRTVETGLVALGQVVGGRGFLFSVIDGGKIVVINAMSGVAVTSLVVSFTPHSPFFINQLYSLLD